jgi:hypothetical protein
MEMTGTQCFLALEKAMDEIHHQETIDRAFGTLRNQTCRTLVEYERSQQDRSQKWARILENATDVAVNDTDVFGDGDQSNIQAENISDRGSALRNLWAKAQISTPGVGHVTAQMLWLYARSGLFVKFNLHWQI